jgi:tetratricopeptide (TPR) repeat protein
LKKWVVAVKRNRWLVVSVLVVALGAFLALSLIPLFAGRGDRPSVASAPGTTTAATDPRAELEARAKGYELVLEREPDNQTAIMGLVDTRIQLGDLAGVVAPLEKLASLNPEVSEYQVLLGQTKQAMGDLEGAAQAYRAVLTTSPGNMNALQGLVALLLQQNRPQAAIGLLQDTLKTAEQTADPSVDAVSVRLLLAQVYVEQDQLDAALKLYDETIALSGDDFRPLLAKALVLQDTGKAAEAKALFAQAESLAPAQFKDQIQQLAAGSTPTESLVPAPETDRPAEDGSSGEAAE